MSLKEQRLQELTNIAPTVSVKMDMEWLGATTNTADFQIRLTSTGTTAVKLNALIIRGVHSHPGSDNPIPSEEDMASTVFDCYKFIVGFNNRFYIYWYDKKLKSLMYEELEERHLV